MIFPFANIMQATMQEMARSFSGTAAVPEGNRNQFKEHQQKKHLTGRVNTLLSN